jgi:cobalt-zinc-cadmium efflux system outer membrane protein
MLKLIFAFVLLFHSAVALSQSLSVQMAVERALSQNLVLKRQVALQSSVEARALIALSPEKPVVSFYIEDMLNSPTENQIVRRWQISQGFEFPLTTYFRASAQSKLATAAANETKEVESEIAARTRKAYARAVMAQAMKTLAEENYDISRRFFEISKRLAEVGEVSQLQALRAKIELVRAENFRTDMLALYAEAQRDLALLLGESEQTAFTLTDTVPKPLPAFDFATLFQTAIDSRPMLKAMQLRQESAELARSAAYSALLPTIRVTLFQQRFTPALNPLQNFYGGEIALSLPLWFWLGERGEIAEKSALQRAQEYDTRFAIAQLNTELRNAFTRYESAKRQAEQTEREELTAAQQAFAAAERQLQTANIGYIEYLEAKRTYFEAQRNALEKRFAAEAALAELLRTVGIINFNDQ